MPHQARSINHQSQISSYHRLVRRVNHYLSTPRALREGQANLHPQPEDRPEDWERLIDEIEQSEHAKVIRRTDGSLYVHWRTKAKQA